MCSFWLTLCSHIQSPYLYRFTLQLHTKKQMQGVGLVYLPSLSYHSHLVCMIFCMPSLSTSFCFCMLCVISLQFKLTLEDANDTFQSRWSWFCKCSLSDESLATQDTRQATQDTRQASNYTTVLLLYQNGLRSNLSASNFLGEHTPRPP